MGTVSYENQGRKIESARMNNLTAAYVVNGWESELTEKDVYKRQLGETWY